MFVLASTYRRVLTEYAELLIQHALLKKEWNALVDRINDKGGERFLKGASVQFTQDELMTLVKFCHPDKHGGNKEAEEITKRLLAMRDSTP